MKAVSYDSFGGPEAVSAVRTAPPDDQITPAVDEVLSLSQAAETHRRLESREVRGVIVWTQLSNLEECHDKYR